jgi:hypothetical protein
MPKAFEGHIAVIQRNAVRSWLELRPRCEVILLGDDAGTAGVAREFGVRHVPRVARNEHGTPLVSDVFARAERAATHDLLCYVNADIVLMSDFLEAVERVAGQKRRFLLVGQRWDVDLAEPWRFGSSRWEAELRARVREEGELHGETGIDYFVFRKGLFDPIPAFAIGRGSWDNWLVYRARARRAAVVDATRIVMAVHQNHAYAHVPGEKEPAWNGKEALQNRNLVGDRRKRFTLWDANWLLTAKDLQRARTADHRQRARVAEAVLHPRRHAIRKGVQWLLRVRRRMAGALLGWSGGLFTRRSSN